MCLGVTTVERRGMFEALGVSYSITEITGENMWARALVRSSDCGSVKTKKCHLFFDLEHFPLTCSYSLSLQKINTPQCISVPTYNGLTASVPVIRCSRWPEEEEAHLFKKSQTWVKEGGRGHPTRLLLVVQQLVAGLKVLITVFAAVLSLLCRVGGRNVSTPGLTGALPVVVASLKERNGANHEYQEPCCHMNTLQPS